MVLTNPTHSPAVPDPEYACNGLGVHVVCWWYFKFGAVSLACKSLDLEAHTYRGLVRNGAAGF
jgi:hypothetical protein